MAQPDGARYQTLQWLQETTIATAVREGRWLYPAIETLHIIGFVILVGAAAMFDLRLLGASKHLPVKAMARHLLSWSMAAVLLVVPTGLTLFMTAAAATWQNPAFRLKLILIALAATNALAFRLYTLRTVDAWNTEAPTPTAARANAISSLLLWAGVITCGRLIAYL